MGRVGRLVNFRRFSRRNARKEKLPMSLLLTPSRRSQNLPGSLPCLTPTEPSYAPALLDEIFCPDQTRYERAFSFNRATFPHIPVTPGPKLYLLHAFPAAQPVVHRLLLVVVFFSPFLPCRIETVC